MYAVIRVEWNVETRELQGRKNVRRVVSRSIMCCTSEESYQLMIEYDPLILLHRLC